MNPFLWFCAGTSGELIKIYPIIRTAEELGMPWFVLSTGQSPENFWRQWDDFKLPRDRAGILMPSVSDLDSPRAAIGWFLKAMSFTRSHLQHRIQSLSGRHPDPEKDFWIVHGDTLSTWIGTYYGLKLKLKVSHVEAGLRSASLFKPFPEELTRRWVSRFAHSHFTPDIQATENLVKRRRYSNVTCTNGNTLLDTVRWVLQDFKEPNELPVESYGVANLHRFENLNSVKRWRICIETLVQAAKQAPIYWVMHPPTLAKIDSEKGLRDRLNQNKVYLIDRQPFSKFVHYLNRAEFIITDGGSNQEECAYLGKPCLILRDTTERQEGLGASCVLSHFDQKIIDQFLLQSTKFKSTSVGFSKSDQYTSENSPSRVILDSLISSRSEF